MTIAIPAATVEITIDPAIVAAKAALVAHVTTAVARYVKIAISYSPAIYVCSSNLNPRFSKLIGGLCLNKLSE